MSEPTTMTTYSNVSTIRNCNAYSTRLKEPFNGAADCGQKENRNYVNTIVLADGYDKCNLFMYKI